MQFSSFDSQGDDMSFNNVSTVDELMPVLDSEGKEQYEIWFTNINIDSKRASYHVQQGNLERLAEGVLINVRNPAGLPEMTPKRRRDLILRHAVRIAKHIYRNVILSDSSAYHNGPVDGVLALAVLKKSSLAHKSIGGVLQIYHSVIEHGVPPGVQLSEPEIEDTLGPAIPEALPDELLILRYFTAYSRKPPAQAMLSLGDLHDLIQRTVQKHGTKEKLLVRLDEIATAMNYRSQLKLAAEAIDRTYQYQQRKENLHEYYVYWNRVRTGKLSYDGSGWQFAYDPAFKVKLTLNKEIRPGVVPSFLGSILPEKGEIDQILEQGFKEFRFADRYLANITVRRTSDTTVHESLLIDKIHGSLAEHWLHGFEFGGALGEDLAAVLKLQAEDPTVLSNAAYDPRSPRMSGVQLKLAGHLSADGTLSLANDRNREFTHIIKPPPAGVKCTLGTMEWFGMSLATMCDLVTEKFAIADIGGHGPTFIAERFDIQSPEQPKSMMLVEDMWSIAGLRNPQFKYHGDINDVARTIVRNSTDPEVDGRRLLKQVLFSWLIANSDLHLKNLMMVKVANPDLSGFEHVRLSPAYDLLPTNVYPNDPKSAALKMGGSAFYTVGGFKDLGKVLKIKPDEVEQIIKDMIVKLVDSTKLIVDNAPQIIKDHEPSMLHLYAAMNCIRSRCKLMVEEMTNAKKSTNKISFAGARPAATSELAPAGSADDESDNFTFSAGPGDSQAGSAPQLDPSRRLSPAG